MKKALLSGRQALLVKVLVKVLGGFNRNQEKISQIFALVYDNAIPREVQEDLISEDKRLNLDRKLPMVRPRPAETYPRLLLIRLHPGEECRLVNALVTVFGDFKRNRGLICRIFHRTCGHAIPCSIQEQLMEEHISRSQKGQETSNAGFRPRKIVFLMRHRRRPRATFKS